MMIVPTSIKEANNFIRRYHRHNLPVVGGKFAIALMQDDKLIGVAVAGRPVARLLDDGKTLEILRVATDGTRNANSCLYGRVKRIGQLMGYVRIITYTLKTESGVSLKAIGAVKEAEIKGNSWSRIDRSRKEQFVFAQSKIRWRLF